MVTRPTFVPYLRLQDYLTTIQTGQLSQQILDPLRAGGMQLIDAESWAIGKVVEHIEQQYDVYFEITETKPYEFTKKYYAGSRVTLDFPAWIPGTGGSEGDVMYLIGDCVIYEKIAYICIYENSDSTFKPYNWQRMGMQYDIYYIDFPYPIFRQQPQQQKGSYRQGVYSNGSAKIPRSKVWWDNKTYDCLISTAVYGDQYNIQFSQFDDIPKPNVFPNDLQSGGQYWKDNGEYSFVGQYPNQYTGDQQNLSEGMPADYDPSKPVWILGDNRNPIIKEILVSLSLWLLHSRISPNNIPELRERNKNSAIEQLRAYKKGTLNLTMEPLQPEQGSDIQWGSKPKYSNRY